MAPDLENRVGDQDIGSPGRPVSSGFLLSCEPGHCHAKTNILGEFPAVIFLQNVLQVHQQSYVIVRVDSLALRKVINEEYAVLIPKNRGGNLLANFCIRIFWGAVSRYAATPLNVASSPGHSDITRFRPWSQIATDRKLFRSRRTKFPKFAQTTGTVDVQAFRDPLRGEVPHVQIFMNDGPNPLT